MPLDPALVRETMLDYALRTVWALVVALVAIVIARAIRAAAIATVGRARGHPTAGVLVGNLAQVLVLTLGILGILAIYTRGAFALILTSLTFVGLVLGLALQDILKNFFAGLWVLIERPFRIGDTIEVGGLSGEVREIAFRTTHLRTGDGNEVIVPNAKLMTDPVVRFLQGRT